MHIRDLPMQNGGNLPQIPQVATPLPVSVPSTAPYLTSDEAIDTTQAHADAVNHMDASMPVSHHVNNADHEVEPHGRAIREIINQKDPLKLEAGVEQALKILERLRLNFCHTESPETQAWMKRIDELIPQATPNRTIIGVVGNTGGGKSSVINALLDEERLVPTNCMRACTAVVTEISFNTSTDPDSMYRAEVEFITREEWEKELAILLTEFLTETGGLSREAEDKNSDAGVAWAKFQGVYPSITRNRLGEYTTESLLAEESVLTVLGTTKQINTADSISFYQQLQQYMDSKEKVPKKNKDKKSKPNQTAEIEYWPLVKVVRIYVKAQSLSTGAVIVDLPGVHDSNTARAAVAQEYLKQCSAHWIVAPINRAVDDKSAKTLLGLSFKRQLMYDGGFSGVTFICSKTDDISVIEALDTLQLEDEVEELSARQCKFEKDIEAAKEQIEKLEESHMAYKLAFLETSANSKVWKKILTRINKGETVYAPESRQINKRRKLASRVENAHKRQQRDHDGISDHFLTDDEEILPSGSEGSSSDEEAVQAPRVPLTEEQVEEQVEKSHKDQKTAQRSRTELVNQIAQLKSQINEYQTKITAIESEIRGFCITERNKYSKEAIQWDYAAGRKELDEENAAEDEDNFDPNEVLRDYDEFAKSLPVFCVSSRAYQQMNGRLQRDNAVPGFRIPEQTEIPQLQAHCEMLTEATRAQTARSFLFKFCIELNTLSLRASKDCTRSNLVDEDKFRRVEYLKRLSELNLDLRNAVQQCLNTMKQDLDAHIFKRYPCSIKEAISKAPGTVQGWGLQSRDGGLHFSTYRAVVRYMGQYKSCSAGLLNFNADLVEPIKKNLATGWELAFQKCLPEALKALTTSIRRLLHVFHEEVAERVRSNEVDITRLPALKDQTKTHGALVGYFQQDLIKRMQDIQREASRTFDPTIQQSMRTTYKECFAMQGVGSYKRMKSYIVEYVDKFRSQMFNEVTSTLQDRLEAMCEELEEDMLDKVRNIHAKIQCDYEILFRGHLQNENAAHAQRDLPANVREIIESVDALFAPIARGSSTHDPQPNHEDPIVKDIVVDQDNDGIAPNHEDPIVKDMAIDQDNGGLAPNHEDPIVKDMAIDQDNDGLVPNHEDPIVKDMPIDQDNDGLVPNHEDPVVKDMAIDQDNSGLAPNHEDPIVIDMAIDQDNDGIAPNHEDPIIIDMAIDQDNDGIAPNHEDPIIIDLTMDTDDDEIIPDSNDPVVDDMAIDQDEKEIIDSARDSASHHDKSPASSGVKSSEAIGRTWPALQAACEIALRMANV